MSIYAKSINRFARVMQAELEINSETKGDFAKWAPTMEHLLSEIDHHVAKLKDALANKDKPAVTEFSADVANYMMKAHQVFGSNDSYKPSPRTTSS